MRVSAEIRDFIKLKSFNLKVSSILLFWYLSLFPGRLGYDYAMAIRMIQNGDSTNWWTGVFFWFLRITTFYGRSIAFTSLIGLLVLAHSLWFFLKSAISCRAVLERSYVITLFFPLFGVFGLTVSHDVFQTSGIIVILGLLISFYKSELTLMPLVKYFGLASIYLITTQTGIVTIFLGAFFLLFSRFRVAALIAPIAMTISLIGNFGVGPSLIKHPSLNLLLVDLKCVAQHPEAEISDKDWNILEKFADRNNWLKPLSCSNPDAQLVALNLNDGLSLNSEISKAYLRILAANPAVVLQAHLQRSLGALPPPFFQGPENQVDRNIANPVGLGTNTALQKGPEILHPSIDEPSVANKFVVLKPLEVIAQVPTFLINQASWFWGWGGLWLWPILIFYISVVRVRRVSILMLLIYPTLVLHLSYLAIGPGPLGRYYMSTILVGLALTIAMLTNYFMKLEAQSDF